MLQHALKEWAVICEALADGRQALILRKGGIAEAGGAFRLEQTRFWLFPTYVHQQRTGIKPEAMPLLERVEVDKPPQGVVRLTHFAEVAGVYHLHDLMVALLLDHHHIWSQETVRSRFAYRTPGLYLMPLRVFRASQAMEIPNLPAYDGCRSWVELERALPTEGALPVLSDDAFQDLLKRIDHLLNPSAFA
jgi:hypothetical protein